MVEIEQVQALIAFCIGAFIAISFWVSYYRTRSVKLLLVSLAFTLFSLKALGYSFGLRPPLSGPVMLLHDIVVLGLIALSIIKFTGRGEDESKENKEEDRSRGDDKPPDPGDDLPGEDKEPAPGENKA